MRPAVCAPALGKSWRRHCPLDRPAGAHAPVLIVIATTHGSTRPDRTRPDPTDLAVLGRFVLFSALRRFDSYTCAEGASRWTCKDGCHLNISMNFEIRQQQSCSQFTLRINTTGWPEKVVHYSTRRIFGTVRDKMKQISPKCSVT